MPRELITRDWIVQHGASKMEIHINMGDRHSITRRVIDKRDGRAIGLSYTDTSWKRTRRNAERGGTCQRSWYVASHDGPIATLEEALEILAIIHAAEPTSILSGEILPGALASVDRRAADLVSDIVAAFEASR